MITAEIFLSKWDTEIMPLVSYDEKIIKKLGLTEEVKTFLKEAGLPEAAPPYLTFESPKQGGAVAVGKKYRVVDLLLLEYGQNSTSKRVNKESILNQIIHTTKE